MLFNLFKKNLTMFYAGIIPYFLSYILIIVVSTWTPIYGTFLSYGFICMFFFSSYILDNFSIEKQKKFLLTNYIVNLVFSCIYFASFKGLFPICTTSTKVLFFIIGSTLPTGTNHLLQIVKLYYVDFFSFIFNFFTGILWFLIGLILYFKGFIISFANIFFLIYLILMIGLLIAIFNENQIYQKQPLSIMENYKLIIKDKNYLIVTIFFLIVLHVQFYFLFSMNFNIYYHLFGSIIGCFLYYYILPKITMKNGLYWGIYATICMLILPSPISSIFSGLVASSSFLSYIYVLDKYYYNMCKIFATWNIINFFSKLSIIIISALNFSFFMPIINVYIFLLTIYQFYILYNFTE
jgi:hypothetical protein